MEKAQGDFENAITDSVSNVDENPTITATRPDVVNTLKAQLSLSDLQSQVLNNPDLNGLMVSLNELIGISMSTARASATRMQNQEEKPAEANANTGAKA